MAKRQRPPAWQEFAERRRAEERQRREAVIAEFAAADTEATLHAMAKAIVEYRRTTGLLANAVEWAEAQAPFALLRPGPYWKPKQARQSIDAVPTSE